MKRIFSCTVLVALLLGSSACGLDNQAKDSLAPLGNTEMLTDAASATNPSIGAETADDRENGGQPKAVLWDLLNEDRLTVSEELIDSFFRYYRENSKTRRELALLPSFSAESAPDWDQLTYYIYVISEVQRSDEGQYFLSKEHFEQTVERYFASFEYSHHSSEFLLYTDDGYVPKGFDTSGGVYYRLVSINKDEDIITAVFDGFEITEGDYLEYIPYLTAVFEGFEVTESDYLGYTPYLGHNMKVIMETANVNEIDSSQVLQVVGDTMLQIFKKDNYADILKRDERIEVTFKQSESPLNAFVYISCARDGYSGPQ